MFNRRQLLQTALSATSSVALASAATKRPGNWIDAHVHVWTGDLDKYKLAQGYTRAQMKPPQFLPEDILGHAKGSGVNRVVLIQMSYYQFDNTYMLDVIKKQPNVFRGIAIVDWNGKSPDEDMRKLKPHGVRGFRIYPSKGSTPADWLQTDGFRKMFAAGAKERMSMCPLINPDALVSVKKACEQFPDTPVVIDHMCRIGATGTIKEEDVKALTDLAKHKNVKVKVSAFYALGAKKPPHTDLIPLIKRLIDAYGPQRLMWASDCPFQTVSEKYEDSVSLIADKMDLRASDIDWIMRRTAEESFYR